MTVIKNFTFEVKDYGCDHAQYFQGAGVAYTYFTDIAVGSGSSARAAGEDALEQFWASADKRRISVYEAERLEAAINELSAEDDAHDNCEDVDKPSHEECEWAHFVAIRWTYGKDRA